VAALQADPQSLLNFYRALIGLRNAQPAIASGSFEHSFASGGVAGWQRRQGRDHILVLINYGRSATTVTTGIATETQPRALPAGARLRPLLALDGTRLMQGPALRSQVRRISNRGQLRLQMPPQSLRVWRVER
jgi:hypothetical protein